MKNEFWRNPRNIVLTAGIVGVLLWLTILWPIQLRHRAQLTQLNPAEVERITLQATTFVNGVTKPEVITLTDGEGREFLRLLADTYAISPNHPKGGWTRFACITTKQREFRFPISATSNNGTYFTLYSGERDGWVMGNLRNDALKPFVERIFSRSLGTNEKSPFPPAPN